MVAPLAMASPRLDKPSHLGRLERTGWIEIPRMRVACISLSAHVGTSWCGDGSRGSSHARLPAAVGDAKIRVPKNELAPLERNNAI